MSQPPAPSPLQTSPPGQTAPAKQRLLLLTGLSGAGKSTALDVLEDLGWETIDNFPVRLLKRLVGREGQRSSDNEPSSPLAIGFDVRTRGFDANNVIKLAKELEARSDIELTVMFLDCASAELTRRYNETRRRHPMADGRTVQQGIGAERELLEPLRRWAEIVVDTSALSANMLQSRIRELFEASAPKGMTLTVSSFGFARGMPPLADLVFDMRFLDNPHWVPHLREQTGRDEPVGKHIERDEAFAPAFAKIADLLETLLPRYAAQGKAYVHIAFGCTGGRHRSVYTAEQMATHLRKAGFSPTLQHRNLASRAADGIESAP